MTQLSEAKAILRNFHALKERQYKGDTDAICTLVDLADAVRLAKLTDRQSEALWLIYDDDLLGATAGKRMDISRQAVEAYAETAISKIQARYDKWAEIETEEN